MLVVVASCVLMGCADEEHETAARVRTASPRATVIELFGVLRRPSPQALPARVRRFVDGMRPAERRVLAPNLPLSRPAVPQGGDVRKPWFVIPASDALCLVVGSGGGVCSPLEAARDNRLQLLQIAEPDFVVGNRSTGALARGPARAPNVLRGVVTDDVRSVSARTADGRTVTTVVRDNVYELEGRGLALDVVLHR